jgi:hypothetical protein
MLHGPPGRHVEGVSSPRKIALFMVEMLAFDLGVNFYDIPPQ